MNYPALHRQLMLLGVASRYGKTSQEYEMAGGSRRKNVRRSKKNPKV